MNEPENNTQPAERRTTNKSNANYLAPDSTRILLHGETASRGDERDKNPLPCIRTYSATIVVSRRPSAMTEAEACA
jgi:hypothetical protein